PAAVATAVDHPTTDAVDTTPGALLMDLDFVSRRMLLEILAIVGQPPQLVALDVVQRVGQSHFAVPVMVAVGLAVGGNIDQLTPLASIAESAHQAIGQALAARQQTFKSTRPRHRSIIKEQCDASTRRQLHPVRASWINLAAVNVPGIALSC